MQPPTTPDTDAWIAYLRQLPRWTLDVMYIALTTSTSDSSPINGFDESEWLELVTVARTLQYADGHQTIWKFTWR